LQELHTNYLENNLLSQMRAATAGTTVNVWVLGKTKIKLKIGESYPPPNVSCTDALECRRNIASIDQSQRGAHYARYRDLCRAPSEKAKGTTRQEGNSRETSRDSLDQTSYIPADGDFGTHDERHSCFPRDRYQAPGQSHQAPFHPLPRIPALA
jgi:hypothetical protein